MRRPFSQPIFLVLVVLLTLFAFLPARAEGEVYLPLVSGKPAPSLDLISVQGWVPAPSYYYVAGEFVNNTDGNVRFVWANVSLLDGDGAEQATLRRSTPVDVLAPGMKGPFWAIFDSAPADVAGIKVTLEWSETDDPAVQLEVQSETSAFDVAGELVVTGTAHNQTAADHAAEAIVTAYGADGKVVGVAYEKTQPATIPAGGAADFEVTVSFYKGKPDHGAIADYSVVVMKD